MAFLSLNGNIKVKKETNYCYFAMDLEETRRKFSEVIKKNERDSRERKN